MSELTTEPTALSAGVNKAAAGVRFGLCSRVALALELGQVRGQRRIFGRIKLIDQRFFVGLNLVLEIAGLRIGIGDNVRLLQGVVVGEITLLVGRSRRLQRASARQVVGQIALRLAVLLRLIGLVVIKHLLIILVEEIIIEATSLLAGVVGRGDIERVALIVQIALRILERPSRAAASAG